MAYGDNPYSSASRGSRSPRFSRDGGGRREGERIGRISSSEIGYQTSLSQNPYGRDRRRKRRGSVVPAIIALLLVLGVVGGGAWMFYNEMIRHYDVTVNGEKVGVEMGDTVETLLDLEVVHPTPGNLLAVDGSLLAERQGYRCSVTINGEAGDINSELTRDAVLEIGDGGDKTEDSVDADEVIPVGQGGYEASFNNYWVGSIHLLSDGSEGLKRTSTGTVSGITVEQVITPVVDAGYQIYTASPEDKVIALTFDDGPWPETTDAILDILQQYNAKATFFTIGEQIGEYSAQVKRANDMGCEVLTHTWDHAAGSGQGVNITYMSAEQQIDEVQRGYAAIKEVTGVEPAHVFRAPGGNFYGSAVSNLWPYVDAEIGWDVDTEDWRLPGADAIASRIMSAQPGQVVLMHDGGGDRSQTVEALRIAMPTLVEQGYTFVTVSELLEYGMPS